MRYAYTLVLCGLLLTGGSAQAQDCFETTIVGPSPFMGNHGEVFKTAEGGLYEVSGSYEYLYAYGPKAAICPGAGKMVAAGKTIHIFALQPRPKVGSKSAKRRQAEPASYATSNAPIHVLLRTRGCSYFIADGPQGLYLLEWYGGYDPVAHDGILGELSGYGFKDVLYSNGQSGRVYIDDYMLGKSRALEKFNEKCG